MALSSNSGVESFNLISILAIVSAQQEVGQLVLKTGIRGMA